MLERLYKIVHLHTIKSKIIFWTSLMMIGIICLYFIVFNIYEIRSKETLVLKDLERALALQEDVIQKWYEEKATDIRTLAITAEMIKDLGQLMSMFHHYGQVHPAFHMLFYADEHGNAWFDSDSEPVQIADQDYFQLGMQGQEAISEMINDEYSQDSVVVFSAPVYDEEGKVKGIVGGSVSMEQIDELIKDGLLDLPEQVYLVASDGDVLSAATNEEAHHGEMRGTNLRHTSMFMNALDGETSQDRAMDHREVEVLWSAKWILDNHYLLLITVDREEIVQSVEWFTPTLLILLILMLISAVSVIIWIHTNNELSNARERIVDIRKSLNISLWSRRAPDWGIIQITPGSEHIFGYPEAVLKAHPDLWLNMIHDEDRLIKAEMLETLQMKKQVVQNQFRILTGDGTIKWIQNHIKPVLNNQGELLRIDGITQDISISMMMKKELVLSEEKFRTLFYRAGIGVAILDAAGVLLEMNPSLGQMLGYSSDEIKGKHFETLLYKDSEHSNMDKFERRAMDRTVQLEHRLVHKDGSLLWVRMTLSTLQTDSEKTQKYKILMLEDITHYKNTLAALEESKNLYRSLVDLSPDAIMVHSDNVIVYVNEQANYLLGAKRSEEILFKNMLDFIDPAFHDETVERIRKLYEHGEPIMNIEQRYVRLDGTMIDVELSASVVTYLHKQAILVLARDVTERKKNEERIQQINELLHKLSSTDGLTELANRRTFDQTLDKEWKRLSRSGSPLSLIMLDIDDFKPFNDTYGHQGGDHCLKEVAMIINESVRRESDLAARYGGEEFALYCQIQMGMVLK